jgi:hypothetical protein
MLHTSDAVARTSHEWNVLLSFEITNQYSLIHGGKKWAHPGLLLVVPPLWTEFFGIMAPEILVAMEGICGKVDHGPFSHKDWGLPVRPSTSRQDGILNSNSRVGRLRWVKAKD